MSRTRHLLLGAGGLVIRVAVAWLMLWTVVFLLIRGLSADPATAVAGLYTDTATRQHLDEVLGVSTPVWQALVHGVWRAITFDFGSSVRNGRPVQDVLAEPASLSLAIASAVACLAILIAAGVFLFAASRRVRLSRWGVALGAAASGVPPFMLALIFTSSGLVTWLGLPSHGVPADAGMWGWTRALVTPVAVLTLPVAPYAFFRAYAAANEVLGADWFRTFLAYGCTPFQTVFRIGWPSGVAVLLDVGVNTFVTALTASVAVEFVLGIPALGTAVLDAIETHDAPVILAAASGVSLLTIVLVVSRDALRRRLLPQTS